MAFINEMTCAYQKIPRRTGDWKNRIKDLRSVPQDEKVFQVQRNYSPFSAIAQRIL
jgi:hypothetical protein